MSTKKTKQIEALLDEQENLLNSLKREILDIDADGIVAENEQLKESISKIKAENEQLLKQEKELTNKLDETKTALYTKMANEKLSAFNRVQKEIDNAYYKSNTGLESRLLSYRKNCIQNIQLMTKRIDSLADGEYSDIKQKLDQLSNEIEQRHQYIISQKAKEQETMLGINNNAGNVLKNEGLTDIEKKSAVKQRNIESFVGLNILSKAGILLFVVGIIALGRFAYVQLPDMFKGLMIFALGMALVGIGEFFHKKEKTVFSTALISGGVTVLYASVATSYFALELFSVEVTFILIMLVTAVAFALSYQLKSQVVCAFGAVGGYLPLVATYMIGFGSVAADKTFLPVSAIYFCILATIIFTFTYNKKWYVAQYIGYFFQILSIIGIARCAWVFKDIAGYGYALPLATIFAILSYVIYIMMPASKIITHKNITVYDTVLLGLNSVSGAISISVTLYNCFTNHTLGNRLVGFLLLIFALIYCALIWASRKEKAKVVTSTRGVLGTVALLTSMLIVPFIFGWEYAGIAWTVEGVLIAIISIDNNNNISEFVGALCIALAPVVFFASDGYGSNPYKALVIVSFSVFVIGVWAYIIKGMLATKQNSVYYIVLELINSLISIGYIYYIYKVIMNQPFISYYSYFTDNAVFVLSVCVVTLAIQSKILNNKVVTIFNSVLRFALLFITLVSVNIIEDYDIITNSFGTLAEPKAFIIINIILLIATNIFVMLLLASSTSQLLKDFNVPTWTYTAVISISSLILITSVLMGQFGLEFSNVTISALYIAMACLLLFVGFRKNYTVVRSGGLVLILCAFAKLCFVDTHGLDKAWKIGAYFAFGTILIVISYFYQRLSKKLENVAIENIADENKTDEQ